MKQYVQLGMVLLYIHRGVKFTQSAWLKPYISFNTEMRKRATNDFEKDFFKLMNNSIFGKSLQIVRKHIHLELVHTERRMKKLAAKPNFD